MSASPPIRPTRGYFLGKGTYGHVYTTSDPTTVFKFFKDQKHVSSSFLMEYAAMKLLEGKPHILQMKSVDATELKIYSQRFDLNLNDYLIRNKPELPTVRRILYNILVGLYHAHAAGIAHHDIKPTNILVNTDGIGAITNVAICDWGSAYPLGPTENDFEHNIQSMYYRAPEVMLCNGNYSSKVDLWSVGCIMIDMLCRHHLISATDDFTGIVQIFRRCGTPAEFRDYYPHWNSRLAQLHVQSDLHDADCMDLLTHLLDVDPLTRFGCVEALEHKFFDSIREDKFKPIGAIETPKRPVLEEVDQIKYHANANLVSARATELAQYYYWICAKKMDCDTELDIYACGCVVLTARLLDYFEIKHTVPTHILLDIFDMVSHDIIGLDHFGIQVESIRQLQPMPMVAEHGSLHPNVNSFICNNFSHKYVDAEYQYRFVQTSKVFASYFKHRLLTSEQLAQLNPRLADTMTGWTHFATFTPRYEFLWFRRKNDGVN